MMPKTINIGQRWDTTHATEAPSTINFPSSRKFWCSLMVSSPLSHVRLFSLAFFCSASTQIFLTHTVGSNRIQRSLADEVLNHWKICKDHTSVSYIQFKGRKTHSRRYDNDIDTEHEIENPPYLARILWLRPLQLVTCTLHCSYVKIKSHALIVLRQRRWVKLILDTKTEMSF